MCTCIDQVFVRMKNMNKNKGEDYAEKMEMMTNKAAKDIVHYLTSHVDHSKTYTGSGVLCA